MVELPDPLVHHCGGAHYQGGPQFGPPGPLGQLPAAETERGQEGDDLNRFAQTHFIPQDASHALLVQLPQPLDANPLVLIQLGPDPLRRPENHPGLVTDSILFC